MREDSITLYLELEKAKRTYNKSLKTMVISALLLVVFAAIALPGITKASFVGSDVINGPVIEGKPTIELDAYGVSFNPELLKTDADAKQWETAPKETNRIKVYVEPAFSVADITAGKDKNFAGTGRLRYNLYFVNGTNRSRVYSDQEVYVYFSPGSAYTTYKNLQSEFSLKQSLLVNDKDFHDYYLSNFLFLELYLKEALPQNGTFTWAAGNGIDATNLTTLNNAFAAPASDSAATLKNRSNPYHAAGTDKGLYLAPYSPIQYQAMPEWETAYRLPEVAYVAKTYFPEGLGDSKSLTQRDLEVFYTKLMNVPGLYDESFRTFYDPTKHLGLVDDFYTLSRTSVSDVSQLLSRDSHSGYYNAAGTLVGSGYDFLALPTFAGNFYRPATLVSPLNLEYGFLANQPALAGLNASDYGTAATTQTTNVLVPLATDNGDSYLANNGVDTFSVYTLERNSMRLTDLTNKAGGISTAGIDTTVPSDKLKSQVVPVLLTAPADFPGVKENYTYTQLKTMYDDPKNTKLSDYKFTSPELLNALFNTISDADRKSSSNDVVRNAFKPYQTYQILLSTPAAKTQWDRLFADAGSNGKRIINIGLSNQAGKRVIEDGINTVILGADNPAIFDAAAKLLGEKSSSDGTVNQSNVPILGDMMIWLAGATNPDSSQTWTQMAAPGKLTSDATSDVGQKSWNPLLRLSKVPINAAAGNGDYQAFTVIQWLSAQHKTFTLVPIKPKADAAGNIIGSDRASATTNATPVNNVDGKDFFTLLIDALVRFVKFILDNIIGNIFKMLAQLDFWVGGAIFKSAALGTANATQAAGPMNYLSTTMHGNTVAGGYSAMEQGYIMLQNLSLLMLVLIVVWYGFGAAVGDAAGGLIAQTELKDMFPRLAVAVFMIGTTVGGHIFSGSLILANLMLWVMDSLTIAVLSSGGFANFDNLFNVASKLGTGTPDFIAAAMLFLISLVMLVLFIAAACLFVARIILIWVLVLMGPLAWMFYAHHSTQSITRTWLKMLTQTIAIQFFWIVMLLIFTTIFAMDFTNIIGFGGTPAGSTVATATVAPSGSAAGVSGSESYVSSNATVEAPGTYTSAIQGYNGSYDKNSLAGITGDMTSGGTGSNSLGIDSTNIQNVGSYKGVSNGYQDRSYYNQETVVSDTYTSNVARQTQLLKVAGTWYGDAAQSATTGSVGNTPMDAGLQGSFTQIMNVLLSGIISGIFFFTLLKFTSRFASSALVSGMSTVNGVGGALREQLSRTTNLPGRAARSTIKGIGDRVAHPFKTTREDLSRGRAATTNAASGIGSARRKLSAAGNAIRTKGPVGAAGAAVQTQADKVRNFGSDLGHLAGGTRYKGDLHEKMNQLRTKQLPAPEAARVQKLMAQHGIAGDDYQAALDNPVSRNKLESVYAKEMLDTEREATASAHLTKHQGHSLEELRSEAKTAANSGDSTTATRLNRVMGAALTQVDEQLGDTNIQLYQTKLAAGEIATDHNYERLIAAKEIVDSGNLARRTDRDQKIAKVKALSPAPPQVEKVLETIKTTACVDEESAKSAERRLNARAAAGPGPVPNPPAPGEKPGRYSV